MSVVKFHEMILQKKSANKFSLISSKLWLCQYYSKVVPLYGNAWRKL